ncbi:MAG: FMN-dependent NADH-azoreductase [Sarcina sp.]
MIKFLKKLFGIEGEQKMEKVLYIIANPKEESKSFGLQVGREFINEYKVSNKNIQVSEINLYEDNIPLIDKDILTAWDELAAGVEFDKLTDAQKTKVARFNELTDQFVEADKYVFVTPMWNLAMPPMMKAYLDIATVAGKTFKYTENGPVGLLNGKKAMHIYATGGVYSEGPAKAYDHGDSYLRAILAFIGISDVETVFVEGMAATPQNAEEIKEKAIEKAKGLAKTF